MIGGCFVTGTDTEVGKSHVAAGILHLLGQQGRSAGLKPIAAGLVERDGRCINEDVELLRGASSLPLTSDDVGPLQLREPCAPHIAAALEGRTIDRAALLAHARAMAARCDWLVIEGVGGFCVPLSPSTAQTDQLWDSADLAHDACTALGLPVVLVVGLRLGCLNHAWLTLQAVRARGLRVAGWVANTIDAGMLHPAENLATLHQWLTGRASAPCLGVVPLLAEPTLAAIAAHLDAPALRRALTT